MNTMQNLHHRKDIYLNYVKYDHIYLPYMDLAI